MIGHTTREALRILDESMKKFEKTLAKEGKTLEDWLEEQRIKNEETRRRVAERERKKQEALQNENKPEEKEDEEPNQ